MKKHGRGAWDGAGRQVRPRFGTKAATALATLSLVASMCPGAMALAYANGELAAGSGDLQL